LHGLVCSFFSAAFGVTTLRRMHIAAAKNQNAAHDQSDGRQAAEPHDPKNRGAVPCFGRVILKAVQKQVIDWRSNFSSRSVHESQPNIARGILDSVVVA